MSAMQLRLSGHRFSALLSALAISASLVLEPGIAQADIHLLAPSRSIDPAMPLRFSLMLTAEDDSRDFSLPDELRISLTPDLGASTRIELIRKSALPDPISIPDTGWNVGGNAVGISAGYEHESNGRDGEDSRSLDVLFALPNFAFGDSRDFHWEFSPKLYAYIEKD
jgi:hypothetical protein